MIENQPSDNSIDTFSGDAFDAAIDDGPLGRAELLVNMLIDDCISDVEFTELSGMLNTSADTRQLYVDTMTLHVDLLDHFARDEKSVAGKAPVLGFLGDLMPLDTRKASEESAS